MWKDAQYHSSISSFWSLKKVCLFKIREREQNISTDTLENIQNNNKHMKRCSISSFVNKMQLAPQSDITTWDFPNDPVAKILHSNAGGMGLIPDRGTRSPHAATNPMCYNYWTHTNNPHAATKTHWRQNKQIKKNFTHNFKKKKNRYHHTYIIRDDDRDWPYKSWQEDWGNKTLLNHLYKCKMTQLLLENIWQFLNKVENGLSVTQQPIS